MRIKRVARRRAVARSILFLVAALGLSSLEVLADGPPGCGAYLGTAEVESALGVKVEAADPVEYSEGFSVCSWTRDRPEGQLGVILSFFDMKAIREGMVSAESVPEFFDLQVSSKRDVLGVEPVKLEGYGSRAVLFSEGVLWTVMIEMKEGFVHLGVTPGDVKQASVEKLAKAISSRLKK